MKAYFSSVVIFLIEITSILTQCQSCMYFDFNDPLILKQFNECVFRNSTLDPSLPMDIKSYTDSSIPPFRSSSRYFLSTNNVVLPIRPCLIGTRMTITSTTTFEIACFFQINGATQHDHVVINVNDNIGGGTGRTIIPVPNEWNVYFSSGFSLTRNGNVSISATIHSGSFAIQYLHIFDRAYGGCIPQTTTTPPTTTTSPTTSQTKPPTTTTTKPPTTTTTKPTTTTTTSPTKPPTTTTTKPPTTTTTTPEKCRWEPGQEIAIGTRCDEQHGSFVFQFDGNAVIYDLNSVPVWDTRTYGIGHTFVFETDGNLVMYSNTGTAVWQSASQDMGGSLLVFQEDRNLVIYNTVNIPAIPLWNTRTHVA